MRSFLRVSPIGCLVLTGCGLGLFSLSTLGQSADDEAVVSRFEGRSLMSSLGCANCHSEFATEPLEIAPRNRVNLSAAINWSRAQSFQESLIHSPTRTPGVPDLFVDWSSEERDGAALALAAYVRSETVDKEESGILEASALRGEILYRQIGCAVCHSLDGDSQSNGSGLSPTPTEWRDHFSQSGMRQFLTGYHSGHAQSTGFETRLSGKEAADVSRFLIPDDEEVPQPILNHTREQINRGRQLFHSQRCDACHSLGDDEGAASAENRQIRLRIPIDGDLDCLSKVPVRGRPWFSLTKQQRALMRETVKLSEQSDALDTETRLRSELQRWRCLDCHRRDGIGGPDLGTLAQFESSEADLGDEGRVPPNLIGVGRKMNQAALIEVIASGEKSRPYMLTRMPAYGRETARKLARLLAASDIPEDEVPTVRETAENQVGRNMWGRALVGSEGLGCITCHALNGYPALGTSAIDLALSPKRLRPEWFRDYLIDPARFRPGTRMPSFWPEGVPSLKGHGGSTSRQIDSLWAYLAEIDQSRLPVGLLDRKELVLQPGERPLVFRTFMKGVGTHAIAVGFRSGPHAAFDALGLRWAYFWEGSFLDAESTWDNRFTPPTEPIGESIVSIQESVPQWDSSVRFMGYALNPVTGVPRFRYEVGSTVLEDWVEPVDEGQKGMVRTIVREESGAPVWIDIASGKSIQTTPHGWLVGDGLKISSAGLLRVSGEANRQRLQVRLPAVATASGIEVQYGW